jgi:hypothetical protein
LVGQLRPAALEDAAPPRRSYWELALPDNDYLLSANGEMVSEMSWSPDRLFSGSQPLLTQRQLEDWMQSSRQDPLPVGANRHLFGSLARPLELHVAVAGRRLSLLVASVAALTLGLLLLYFPASRGAVPLMVGAIALGAAALAFPETALLLARAAFAGLAVAAAVGVWRWLVLGPHAPVPRPLSTVTALPGAASTNVPRVERSPPITTATAPAALPAGEPQL